MANVTPTEPTYMIACHPAVQEPRFRAWIRNKGLLVAQFALADNAQFTPRKILLRMVASLSTPYDSRIISLHGWARSSAGSSVPPPPPPSSNIGAAKVRTHAFGPDRFY